MTKNFNILVNKLNAFKRKFYLYKLLKGFIITLFAVTVLLTGISILEYFIYLDTEVRKIIFFGIIIFIGLLIIQFIGIPLLRLVQIIKPLDFKGATFIIQRHFKTRSVRYAE